MAISVVNSGTSTSGALGFTATAGRIVIAAVSVRDWEVTWTPGGSWTLLAARSPNSTNFEPPCFLFGKLAAGGETTVGGSFSSGAGRAGCAIEVTGATLTGVPAGAENHSIGNVLTIPDATPPAGSSALVVGAAVGKFSLTPPGGAWTSVGQVLQNGNQWPFLILVYQNVTGASGSYGVSIGASNGEAWSAAGGMYIPAVPSGKSSFMMVG